MWLADVPCGSCNTTARWVRNDHYILSFVLCLSFVILLLVVIVIGIVIVIAIVIVIVIVITIAILDVIPLPLPFLMSFHYD